MRQLVMKIDFDDQEIAIGADKYMLRFLSALFRDTTNRTTVELVDVED